MANQLPFSWIDQEEKAAKEISVSFLSELGGIVTFKFDRKNSAESFRRWFRCFPFTGFGTSFVLHHSVSHVAVVVVVVGGGRGHSFI